MRRFFLPMAALLILPLLISGCSENTEKSNKIWGTIEAKETRLALEAGGTVKTVAVKEGQQVKVGQELLKLDTTALEIQVRQAEAALIKAKADSDAVKAQLADSDARVRGAQAGVQVAEQALRLTELRMQQASLKSVGPGTIVRILVRPGELAVPGVPLVVLTDPDSFEVTFYVPAKSVSELQIGKEIQLRPVDSTGTIPAGVFYISPKASFAPPSAQRAEDRENEAFLVKAKVLERTPRLRAGLAAEVEWGER